MSKAKTVMHAYGNEGTQRGAHAAVVGYSRPAAMRQLGSVVYAARLADGTVKIGWTKRFDRRLSRLSSHTGQAVELLAFKVGDYEDEQRIHRDLTPYRIPGKIEYYRPVGPVMSVVNQMRDELGLPRIAA